jgi:hypothetical protein
MLGCGAVKEKKLVKVPPAYAQAQQATPQELVDLVNSRYAGIDSVTVPRFEVEFTGGSIDERYLEKYRKAKGYLIARKPDSIFVNLLNPLTSSSVLVMASRDEQFQIWVPSKNQYVLGSADLEAREENAAYNVRPSHILEGILVKPIPLSDRKLRYFKDEDQDRDFRYYVVGIVQLEEDSPFAELKRKIWVERSTMQLRREQYYQDSEMISEIVYGAAVRLGEKLVNTQIEIRRPRERYSISFQLDPESIDLNREIKANAFEIMQPPGAELILVEEDESE